MGLVPYPCISAHICRPAALLHAHQQSAAGSGLAAETQTGFLIRKDLVAKNLPKEFRVFMSMYTQAVIGCVGRDLQNILAQSRPLHIFQRCLHKKLLPDIHGVRFLLP